MTAAASLDDLATALRAGRGLAHKRDIEPVVAALAAGHGHAVPLGDDCAAIPDGDGHLLFAIEGFLDAFVEADPWFAGYCGVMVNVADVAAMGGRPIAVVDAVWSRGAEHARPVLDGLAAGSRAYGVPVVGGHANGRSGGNHLAVAVLGRARRLLTSFDAAPGDALVAAIDLRGRYREPHPYWDASTGAPPGRPRRDLDILPAVAEAGLCAAAKDVSMAGVVGTALMLLECSGLGATLDVTRVPRPAGVSLERWLLSFPSFGFLLSVPPGNVAAIVERFAARGIAAAAFGTTEHGARVRLADGVDEALLWDFDTEALTGCGVAGAGFG